MASETQSIGGERRGSPVLFAKALGLSLAFIVVVFGGIWILLNVAQGPLRPSIDNYFAKFNSGDFKGIYAAAAEALSKEVSEEKFVERQQIIHEKLGDYKSKTIRGINIVRERGPASTVITYDAEFANGPATVTLAFQGSGAEGKLVRAEFRSKLIPDEPQRGRGRRG